MKKEWFDQTWCWAGNNLSREKLALGIRDQLEKTLISSKALSVKSISTQHCTQISNCSSTLWLWLTITQNLAKMITIIWFTNNNISSINKEREPLWVVLLDWNLPKLAKEMKAWAWFTTQGMESIPSSTQANCKDSLTSPISLSELVAQSNQLNTDCSRQTIRTSYKRTKTT